jgi:integration host factor subunit alpha
MRINLTKKDLINSIYMQIGFSKKISENLLEDILGYMTSNIINHKKLKLSNFGTFTLRVKKSRIGRNPKTKEKKLISNRNVVLFKSSNELKNYINKVNEKR